MGGWPYETCKIKPTERHWDTARTCFRQSNAYGRLVTKRHKHAEYHISFERCTVIWEKTFGHIIAFHMFLRDFDSNC